VIAPEGDLTALYMKNITLHGIFLTRERKRLDQMRHLFERGQAKVFIDQILPLEQVSSAHARLDSRHGHGKIVLELSQMVKH
jgi:NADPH2:quinone reductase